MDFQIQISEPALAEFESLLDYSWSHFPESSERFGNDLLDHLELLRKFPYLGIPVPEHPNIRELVHTPILIYYKVRRNPDRIEILHFWNALKGDIRL